MSDSNDEDTNKNKATLEIIAEHIAIAVQPLDEAVSDLESFQSFMLRLGWEVTSLPPEFRALASLVKSIKDSLDLLLENFSTFQLKTLLEDIQHLYVTIKGIMQVPDGVTEGQAFLSEIGKRLFELLLADYLAAKLPAFYNLLLALGIIELENHAASATRPGYIRTRIRLERISSIISDPKSMQKLIYGWGTNNFQFDPLAQYLQDLILSIGFPSSVERADRSLSRGYQKNMTSISKPINTLLKIPIFDTNVEGIPIEASIALLELPAEGDKLPGIIIQLLIPQGIGNESEINENLTFRIRPGSDFSSIFGILIRPNEPISVRYPFQSNSSPPSTNLGVSIDYKPNSPKVLFGSPVASRLQMGGLSLSLDGQLLADTPELRIEVAFKDLAVILASNEQDSFMSKLLDGKDLAIPIPLGIQWSTKSGFHFSGNDGFKFSINPHLKIGGAKIDNLTLQLLSGDRIDPEPNFATAILLGISGSIGPVSFSMDGIGLQFKTVFKDGNAGPFQIGIDIVPPHGVGLAINGNGVKGGGFISRIENQYSGVIDLDLLGYSIQALAIVRTDPFLSLLFAIFAQFKTAIQLGAGWKITKIGGMLGINHTVSHDKIATGIRSGILDKILFPDNIIRDAPSVIANFETVFPTLNGQNIFGPAIQIAYGTPTLITGDVAVILEFPNPFLLSILGKVTSKLPHKDNPIIQINVGILGRLDLVNAKAEVYGSIYDSKILDFALSGDMAMAASWGSERNFIFSIGGFNPRFNPPSNFPPFNAPPLKRLNLAFSSYVSFECYLALTSNTMQIGARVEALFEKGGATISGFLGFDALVQFNPLYYVIDVAAGFSVKFKGRTLASIAFMGFIEGPNPHRIKGSVTFSILWWDISVDVDKTFGDPITELIVNLDPWPILREALEQNDSWTAELPTWEAIGVVTSESSAGQAGEQLIHPLGKFKVTQRVVPLNHTLTKFGSADPIDNFRFEIISLNDTNASDLVSTQDYFAPGQFAEYPESEKLNLKSYELMDSGVFYASQGREEVAFSFESASSKEIEYETILLENMANKEDIRRTKIEGLQALNTMLSQTLILAGISYHTTVSNSNRLRYQLKHHAKDSTLVNEKFVIVNEDENIVDGSISKGELSKAVALNKLADHRKANPQDKRKLNVISAFELPPEVPV
jgi:hypothetical protein